jgi:protein-S-isoprenylcysteine O-methyltransferase Ste14
VVHGLYRFVRNPIYLAVRAVITGQALPLGRPLLLGRLAGFQGGPPVNVCTGAYRVLVWRARHGCWRASRCRTAAGGDPVCGR